jgi:soluble lytic murein transglycosylase
VAAWLEVAHLRAELGQAAAALRTLDSASARAGRRRAMLVATARVRVLMVLDRAPQADSLLRQLVRDHRGDTNVARVALERADRHRARGEGADERTLYGALIRRFPAAPATATARFRYGLQLYAAGMPDSAHAYVEAAALADSAGALGLGPRYWRARLALERGDTNAPAELRALAQAFPLSFHGVRARELVGDTDFVVDRPLALPRPGSFPPARARDRVRLLAEHGFEVEARAEAVGWVTDPMVSVQVLLAAAQAASAAGYARESITLGEAARTRVGMVEGVARAIYPIPWRDVLEAEAQEHCVDPLLLAALIRQESRFDVRAVSRAGARGMSQVMPATGAELARRLGLGPFDPELLFVPDFNLHLGTRYLHEREVRDTFPPLPLLASYNAGASRVGRWRTWPEFGDTDLFAERVFIPETRDYVRTVYASYVWYRYAWRPPPPAAAPPPLP